MVFPEAYNVGHEGFVGVAAGRFRSEGYSVKYFPNEDWDERDDHRGLLVASRVSVEQKRMETRNFALGISGFLGDTAVAYAAIHQFDPRTSLKETSRYDALDADIIAAELGEENPSIVIGCFNALHPSERRAKLYRAGLLMPKIVTAKPHIGQNERDPRVIASKIKRIGVMASRSLVEEYEQRGFTDVDTGKSKQPTSKFVGGLAKAQLARIMIKGDIVASEPTVEFPKGFFTEHAMVSTTLRAT